MERRRTEDDDVWLASLLGIEVYTLHNVVEDARILPLLGVRELEFVEEEGRRMLRTVLDSTPMDDIRGLSSSERGRVLIVLAIATARVAARFVPTLLLLDSFMATFDEKNLSGLAEVLSDSENHFQTVALVPERGPDWEPLSPLWTFIHLT